MLKGPGKWLALIGGCAAIAVALAAAHFLLPPPQTEDVPLPADDAAPEQVVTAYLKAVNAHDCATAEALMVESDRDVARSWCHDVAALDQVRVSGPTGDWRGGDSVGVAVQFDLDWRFLHDDASLPEGPTTWGYRLERTSSEGRWRIADQGTG